MRLADCEVGSRAGTETQKARERSRPPGRGTPAGPKAPTPSPRRPRRRNSGGSQGANAHAASTPGPPAGPKAPTPTPTPLTVTQPGEAALAGPQRLDPSAPQPCGRTRQGDA